MGFPKKKKKADVGVLGSSSAASPAARTAIERRRFSDTDWDPHRVGE
jgi:hypothetical protein